MDDLDIGVKESVKTVAKTSFLFPVQGCAGDVLGDAFLETHVCELGDRRLDLCLGRLLLDERQNVLTGVTIEVLELGGVYGLRHGD